MTEHDSKISTGSDTTPIEESTANPNKEEMCVGNYTSTPSIPIALANHDQPDFMSEYICISLNNSVTTAVSSLPCTDDLVSESLSSRSSHKMVCPGSSPNLLQAWHCIEGDYDNHRSLRQSTSELNPSAAVNDSITTKSDNEIEDARDN